MGSSPATSDGESGSVSRGWRHTRTRIVRSLRPANRALRPMPGALGRHLSGQPDEPRNVGVPNWFGAAAWLLTRRSSHASMAAPFRQGAPLQRHRRRASSDSPSGARLNTRSHTGAILELALHRRPATPQASAGATPEGALSVSPTRRAPNLLRRAIATMSPRPSVDVARSTSSVGVDASLGGQTSDPSVRGLRGRSSRATAMSSALSASLGNVRARSIPSSPMSVPSAIGACHWLRHSSGTGAVEPTQRSVGRRAERDDSAQLQRPPARTSRQNAPSIDGRSMATKSSQSMWGASARSSDPLWPPSSLGRAVSRITRVRSHPTHTDPRTASTRASRSDARPAIRVEAAPGFPIANRSAVSRITRDRSHPTHTDRNTTTRSASPPPFPTANRSAVSRITRDRSHPTRTDRNTDTRTSPLPTADRPQPANAIRRAVSQITRDMAHPTHTCQNTTTRSAALPFPTANRSAVIRITRDRSLPTHTDLITTTARTPRPAADRPRPANAIRRAVSRITRETSHPTNTGNAPGPVRSRSVTVATEAGGLRRSLEATSGAVLRRRALFSVDAADAVSVVPSRPPSSSPSPSASSTATRPPRVICDRPALRRSLLSVDTASTPSPAVGPTPAPRCRVPAVVRPNVVVARDTGSAQAATDVRRRIDAARPATSSQARADRTSKQHSPTRQPAPTTPGPAMRRPKSAAIGTALTAAAMPAASVIQRSPDGEADRTADSISGIDMDRLMLELQDRVLAEIDRRGGRYGGSF